nr:hypothetical protein KitaXyl93_72940 [Kitasatospora sp. Xyl93]
MRKPPEGMAPHQDATHERAVRHERRAGRRLPAPPGGKAVVHGLHGLRGVRGVGGVGGAGPAPVHGI